MKMIYEFFQNENNNFIWISIDMYKKHQQDIDDLAERHKYFIKEIKEDRIIYRK